MVELIIGPPANTAICVPLGQLLLDSNVAKVNEAAADVQVLCEPDSTVKVSVATFAAAWASTCTVRMGQEEILTQGYSSNEVVLRWVSWAGNWLGALADDSVVHEIFAGCAARLVGIKL